MLREDSAMTEVERKKFTSSAGLHISHGYKVQGRLLLLHTGVGVWTPLYKRVENWHILHVSDEDIPQSDILWQVHPWLSFVLADCGLGGVLGWGGVFFTLATSFLNICLLSILSLKHATT